MFYNTNMDDNGTKKVAVLGSTGSVGRQALDVIRAFPDKFQVTGLAAGNNLKLLKEQINEFHPSMYHSSTRIDYASKFLPLEEIACSPDVDLIIMAIPGSVGLAPTIAAIRSGKTIALASKEILVMAGEHIFKEALQQQVQVLPLDSEHSAIWQCLEGEKSKPEKIFLTASGGPFYNYSHTRLKKVTAEQALYHPTWKMGKRITIDSATLMNKGLETIEARWFFSMPLESIKILIHPQSIVHSLVEFVDGSMKAQLGAADMRLPIQYALSYPERIANSELPRLDLENMPPLTFKAANYSKFPCLKLALDAARMGDTYPAVLCAADEIAVELFLSGQIAFTEIAILIEKALEKHACTKQPSLEEILQADSWGRNYVRTQGEAL